MADTYDIIFAGGGAAACVTAGRLADADPNLKILVLEAGPHTKDLFYHVQPGRYFGNLLVPREIFSFHFGKGGKGTGGRMHFVPSGRAVGGGSTINFAMYMRPAPSDYDDWERVHGNEGWSSRELIPLVKKSETYQPAENAPSHGYSGPLKVSFATAGCNVADEFIAVGKAIEPDHGATDDMNNYSQESINKWGRIQRYIDIKTGKRSDTAHHYIYNADHKNLTVLARHKVARVIFEGTKAVGVEYVDDTVGRGKKETPEILVAKASRLVVLSAGAFGTPSILERSGIGAASVLEKVGIKQLVDLPGVGENYMDHNIVFPPFLASDDAETMDLPFRGNEEEVKELNEEWVKHGKGLFANNGVDGGIKLRPTEAELKTMVGFEERWKSYYENHPDKPVMLMATMAAYVGLNPEVPRAKYFSGAYFSAHPSSTGSVHITSATDLYSALDFQPGFLNNFEDVVILRWAYKRSREAARRMKFYRGELAVGHPNFSKNSAAALGVDVTPVPLDAPRLVYTAEDDEAIDEYHRQTAETTWHSIGTAAMKAREKGGVVDSKLNVYGTTNLKVADCSIAPSNVSANTYSTAVAIGEKAAVIIAEELGIKGVAARP